jgi:hypothetical protein
MDHGRIFSCNIRLTIWNDYRHRDGTGLVKVHLQDPSVRSERAINEGFVFIDSADENLSGFREEVDKILEKGDSRETSVVVSDLPILICLQLLRRKMGESGRDNAWEHVRG